MVTKLKTLTQNQNSNEVFCIDLIELITEKLICDECEKVKE